MMRLPKTSERGAKTMGPRQVYKSALTCRRIRSTQGVDLPTPKPTTKTEMGTRAASWLTLKDSSTPSTSEVMILEHRATTKHVAATTIVMYHLKALDQFLGSSGSPGAKVTSL